MKYKVFALYDNVAKTFLSPTFEASEQVAIRNLDNFVNTHQDSLLYNHPADFSFFNLGSWDSDTGIFSAPEMGKPDVIYTTMNGIVAGELPKPKTTRKRVK